MSTRNLMRVYDHTKLVNLGLAVKIYFKNEQMSRHVFEDLSSIEKRLFECFLKRKKFILKEKKDEIPFEKLLKYQKWYKSTLNCDDKERLVFRFFDTWIKKYNFNKIAKGKEVKSKENIKRNKQLKNRRIYLQVFRGDWVEANDDDPDSSSEADSYALVPVDINKVKEKHEHLKKFGRLFFESPEAKRQMNQFLETQRQTGDSFFFNLVKDSIDDKIDKKIKKFHGILKQVATSDQDKALHWFEEDILHNKRSKLPTLLLDARAALVHFREVYSEHLHD